MSLRCSTCQERTPANLAARTSVDHLSPSMTVSEGLYLYSCMASVSLVLIGFLAHQTQSTPMGSQNFCIIFLRPLLEIMTILTPAFLHSSTQSWSSSAGSFSECNLKVLSKSHKSNLTFSFFNIFGVTSSKRSNFLSARKILMYLF